MRRAARALFIISLVTVWAQAQAPITTVALGPDKIGDVRTALGITTRITFPDVVQEVICGDLYDPATGKGTFVVQRSGTSERPGNDIFLKPVAAKGLSNMFVKTGDGQHTYSFDLTIVAPAQAHRVVYITNPSAQAAGTEKPEGSLSNQSTEKMAAKEDRPRVDLEEQARARADEILRNARQQADRIVGEAETKAQEMEREAATRAGGEAGKRFLQSLMIGVREFKVQSSRASAKTVSLQFDPQRVMVFDDRAYLRFVIQNTGKNDFSFASLQLVSGEGKEALPVSIEITQTKPDNTLASGESLTGVISFDPKILEGKTKLILYLRGEGDSEITRVQIQ